jgi:uncharacterized protein with PQ loop repeat
MILLGYIAASTSLLMIVLGLPRQILTNYRRQSCEGLDFVLVVSAFATYFVWALYGWFKPDKFLLCSQLPGVVLTLVIMIQFAIYRKNTPPK